MVDDVDGLFSEYGLGQFCDLFDVLDRNEACAWLNTQHPGRLFGTPPSGLTDESAALVRRFGTIQA
ncbi:hypothetical protein, partial [Aeromonas veronii]|uniref:hypothetical protein n=1 Tax=Aeromonas veronii TaxID=654 RepID=UPI0038B4758B